MSEIVKFSLKINRDVRDKMKEQTHERGTTIQSTISAFCESYHNNPDKFKLILEVKK